MSLTIFTLHEIRRIQRSLLKLELVFHAFSFHFKCSSSPQHLWLIFLGWRCFLQRETERSVFLYGYDRLQLDNYFAWSFCSLASAHNPTSTLIILDITKASSNNYLESTNCVHVFTKIIFTIHQVF